MLGCLDTSAVGAWLDGSKSVDVNKLVFCIWNESQKLGKRSPVSVLL